VLRDGSLDGFDVEHSLNPYRFVGRILDKALHEGILVDVAFAGFFLAKVHVCKSVVKEAMLKVRAVWGQRSFLDDLASLDPDLYRGLIFLKHYTGNPEDLSFNFTVTVEGTLLVLPLYIMQF
jgi:ubiquitin-protein ligase E3 C